MLSPYKLIAIQVLVISLASDSITPQCCFLTHSILGEAVR